MNDQSKMFGPQTLDLFGEPISSPGLGSGRSPAALPDGPPTFRSGRLRVRASRSPSPAKAPEQMIQGTCGRTYFASSTPSGPLASWENRLRERLATLGSMESALIWKASATPSGRSKSRLVQSMLHKNGPGTGGSQWRTPNVQEPGITVERLQTKDGKAWTPGERAYDKETGRLCQVGLQQEMLVSQWRSQNSRENGGGCYSDPEKALARMSSGHQINLEEQMTVAAVSQWPTPNTPSGGRTMTFEEALTQRKRKDGSKAQLNLENAMIHLAQWCAPSARDWKDTPGMSTTGINPDGTERQRIDMLPRQMAHFGPTPNGSNAQTEKRGASRGAPNPAFACWIMGWPESLILGALRAIQAHKLTTRSSSNRSKAARTSGASPETA